MVGYRSELSQLIYTIGNTAYTVSAISQNRHTAAVYTSFLVTIAKA